MEQGNKRLMETARLEQEEDLLKQQKGEGESPLVQEHWMPQR